jgi:hypothetical protein
LSTTSQLSFERRIAKLESKPADETLIVERVFVEAGVFGEDGELKQTPLYPPHVGQGD